MAGINIGSSIYGYNNIYSSYKTFTNYYNAAGLSTSGTSTSSNINKSKTSEQTQEYLKDIKKYSNQLKTAAENMTKGFPPPFQQMVAASNNNEAVSIKNTSQYGASTNEMTVGVKQVAAKQTNEGAKISATASDISSGGNQFSIDIGGKSFDFNIYVSEGQSNRSVQQKVADEINKRDIGVTASVVYDDKTKESSLVIASKETGEKNSFTVRDTSGELMSELGTNSITTEAQDAVYTVNGGSDRRSSSNEVYIGNGVTAELKKVTEEDADAKINFKRNTENAINAVYDLVNNYNALMDAANSYGGSGSDRIAGQLQNAFKSHATALSKVGITANSEGYISIDTNKLKKAAEDGTLGRAMGVNGSSSTGFASSVQRTARSVESNPAKFLDSKDIYSGSSNSSRSRPNNFYNYMNNRSTGIGLLFDSLF